MVAHGVVRATEDLDFLVDLREGDSLDACMRGMGFERLYRSEDAANYVRGALRVDFLFAHRPISLQLLSDARAVEVFGQPLRVVDAEGIIGLKLQALTNDPTRAQDVSDIRELLRIHVSTLDLARVQHFFRLFDREGDLEQWIAELGVRD